MLWVISIVKKNVHQSLMEKKYLQPEICYGVLKIVILKNNNKKLVKQDLLD